MKALIVCHAGSGIGLGHLTRSLVAGRSLREKLGFEVGLLIQGNPINRTDLNEFEHHFVGVEKDLLAVVKSHVVGAGRYVIVFDLFASLIPDGIGGLFDDLRERGHVLISVDGLVDYRKKLDLIYIPSIYYPPSESLDDSAPIVYGWDHLLLNVRHSPQTWNPGSTILVLTGGSDASGLGNTLPTSLDARLPSIMEVCWITGPYSEQPVWPTKPRLKIRDYTSPDSLDDLMLTSNYAITVFGVSFFELLYYGVPTVVFSPYGSKDSTDLSKIREAGVALVATNEEDAVGQLSNLLSDEIKAQSLSYRARKLVNEPGTLTFSKAVAKLIT